MDRNGDFGFQLLKNDPPPPPPTKGNSFFKNCFPCKCKFLYSLLTQTILTVFVIEV